MADFTPNPVLQPTPTFPALPGILQQVPVHDVEGHIAAAGVYHEDDLVVTHGHSYSYAAPGDVQSVSKQLLEEFAVTSASTPFNLQRIDYLPLVIAGAVQTDLSERRFAMWESFDVEQKLTAILDGMAIDLGSHDVRPADGLAALQNAISQRWPYQPLLLAGRGPEVALERNGALDKIPMKAAYGSGIGPFTADGHARMYVVGALELYRDAITSAPFVEAETNRAGALVERQYAVDVFGPVYRIDVQYIAAEVS